MPKPEGTLPSLTELIPTERISLDVEASDWRDAIRISGKSLVDTQIVETRYIEAMIKTAEELGPYIVIAPQIALPHARPEDGALDTGLSLVRLKT
ncbi:MAG: PTS sugar transporter subunit IIA, partial [Anaerolineales bacterium]